jgi:phosphoribosylamine--glycine ligase
LNILIIGNGGREHALAWKTASAASVEQVFVAPGNAGTAAELGVKNIDIGVGEIDQLADFAADNQVALTIVGPEAPLVAGIVDKFQARGLAIFGPTAAAAELEGSKAYCKAFLERHQIPTAEYQVFTETESAIAYINQRAAPMVVKADGLAAGKGVVIAHSREMAEQAVLDMLDKGQFGEAGSRVVIEDFLVGEEISFICMADGEHLLPMATSQDHKARDEGDTGPNTGGMGAYSPAPLVDDALHRRIMDTIMLPTLAGMKADGRPFTGFLYAGLMIAPDGTPRVLEYNVRMGDPETQPIMMRLESDLVALCQAAVAGTLDDQSPAWCKDFALGVVMAAGGYPGSYDTGLEITGDALNKHNTDASRVFHAGTAIDANGNTVTSGGRVLCVTALGETVSKAQRAAYERVSTIHWDGAFFRRDIGHRAAGRENNQG